MKKDEITEFQEVEYYKRRLQTSKRRTIVYVILAFILGFVIARFIFKAIAYL